MSRIPIDRRTWLLAVGAALASRAGAQGPRTGFEALVGGWSRTDGNYHIVIQSVGPDGVLQASYFNPRPLPFAVAQARREGGAVHARFELRAAGYDGSTYDLRLDAASGRLVGTYYQAVAKQTYDVEFTRK
jgi:hypothetical protein